MEEYVILINDANVPIGTARKDRVHHGETPLHRGFSLFIFNPSGEILLQQRSSRKKTFPGIWSNSCCGHPQPGESAVDGAKRRAEDELGLVLTDVHEIISDYRYRSEMNGVVENEICPILIGFTHHTPRINKEEVEAIRWISWIEWLEEIQRNPQGYSSWSVEETRLLDANRGFRKRYAQ